MSKEPLNLYGVDVAVRKYIPINEAVIVNRGDEIEYARPDGKRVKMVVKEPNGIKIYNLGPTPPNLIKEKQ